MKNKKKFISPSGALLAILCFFMPWIKISCMGEAQYFSGAQLASEHGQHIFWALLACAATILVVFVVCKYRKRLDIARPIVMLCAATGILILLFRYFDSSKEIKTDMGVIRMQDLGITVEFGIVGTFIGFVLALAGTFFLTRDTDNAKTQSIIPVATAPTDPDNTSVSFFTEIFSTRRV
jgi:energy-coupling factor transporter transmembrane protein EcfT